MNRIRSTPRSVDRKHGARGCAATPDVMRHCAAAAYPINGRLHVGEVRCEKQSAVRTDTNYRPSRCIVPRMIDQEQDPDEQLKPIPFTLQEQKLILGLSMMDLDMENRFRLAVVKGGGIVVPLNAYDLDELLGEIAAVANHEKSAKRQRDLDAMTARVRKKLEQHFPRTDSRE
jgi:hypothetical protein